MQLQQAAPGLKNMIHVERTGATGHIMSRFPILLSKTVRVPGGITCRSKGQNSLPLSLVTKMDMHK
jgi:hypothetical protein